ncbi:915_t:CDS:2, partial [Racocetra fulgida]
AHSAMKHTLESSGSLTKAFNFLDRWLHLHHEESLLQYENESICINPLLIQDDKERLGPLLEKLYMIETQYISFLDEQQKSTLLDKLDDVLSILVDKLSNIKVPEGIKGEGRPSGTKRLSTALE